MNDIEWVYAAKAGRDQTYSWGNPFAQEMANCSGCNVTATDKTMPVGSYPSNAVGLHDLSGNVWEMLSTCGKDSLKVDDCLWHVMRGGSYLDGHKSLKTGYRATHVDFIKADHMGFRIVRGE